MRNLSLRLTLVLEGYTQTDIGLLTYLLNQRIKITEETVQKILQIIPTILEAEEQLTTFDKQFLDRVINPLQNHFQFLNVKQPSFQDVTIFLRDFIQALPPRMQRIFQRNPNRYHDLASYIYRNWKHLQLIQDLPEDTPGPEEIEETPESDLPKSGDTLQ
jgi:hypothetical protein